MTAGRPVTLTGRLLSKGGRGVDFERIQAADFPEPPAEFGARERETYWFLVACLARVRALSLADVLYIERAAEAYGRIVKLRPEIKKLGSFTEKGFLTGREQGRLSAWREIDTCLQRLCLAKDAAIKTAGAAQLDLFSPLNTGGGAAEQGAAAEDDAFGSLGDLDGFDQEGATVQ